MSDQEDRREVIEAVHAEGVAAASSLSEGLEQKPDRREVRRTVVLAACFAAALAIIVSVVSSYQVVDLRAQGATERARSAVEQERTRQAIASLEESNKSLQARGQQPVAQPVELGAGEALVTAATARVLATLPPAPGPTSEQISAAIRDYLIANPVSVSPTLIANQVSAYLSANPPPPGPSGERGQAGVDGDKGDKGEPGEPGTNGKDGRDGVDGRTPTPEEIMAVFTQTAAQNPDLLCAGRGKFTEVRGFIRVPPDLTPQEQAFWVCLPQ